MKYAAKTKVPTGQSRTELERILKRYNATGFMYGESQNQALIQFEIQNRRVRFHMPYPTKDERDYEQSLRQRWRALVLCVKGKLEAVENGIETFEQAFLAHIVLPNGQTYGEFAIPQIDHAYEAKQMPPMLPWLGGEQ